MKLTGLELENHPTQERNHCLAVKIACEYLNESQIFIIELCVQTKERMLIPSKFRFFFLNCGVFYFVNCINVTFCFSN